MIKLAYVVLESGGEADSLSRSSEPRIRWAKIGDKTILWKDENITFPQLDSKKTGRNLSAIMPRQLEGQLYLVVQVGSSFERRYCSSERSLPCC